MYDYPIRCDCCGKFMSYKSIEEGKSIRIQEYDFGISDELTEDIYFLCEKCRYK